MSLILLPAFLPVCLPGFLPDHFVFKSLYNFTSFFSVQYGYLRAVDFTGGRNSHDYMCQRSDPKWVQKKKK